MATFVYGGFQFPAQEVAVTSFTGTYIRGATGRPHIQRVSMACKGRILGVSFLDCMAQMTAIQNSLSIDGETASMQGTPFFLSAPNSIGGNSVFVDKLPTCTDVTGANGVTFLNYDFAMHADYMSALPSDVLSFSESLSFSDNQGLPLQIEIVPAKGRPIIQNISDGSFYHCTQSGQMTQAGSNPQPPAPTFPGMFRGVDGSRQVTAMPVKTLLGTPIEYGVSWKYEFISVNPFTGGSPNYR